MKSFFWWEKSYVYLPYFSLLWRNLLLLLLLLLLLPVSDWCCLYRPSVALPPSFSSLSLPLSLSLSRCVCVRTDDGAKGFKGFNNKYAETLWVETKADFVQRAAAGLQVKSLRSILPIFRRVFLPGHTWSQKSVLENICFYVLGHFRRVFCPTWLHYVTSIKKNHFIDLDEFESIFGSSAINYAFWHAALMNSISICRFVLLLQHPRYVLTSSLLYL